MKAFQERTFALCYLLNINIFSAKLQPHGSELTSQSTDKPQQLFCKISGNCCFQNEDKHIDAVGSILYGYLLSTLPAYAMRTYNNVRPTIYLLQEHTINRYFEWGTACVKAFDGCPFAPCRLLTVKLFKQSIVNRFNLWIGSGFCTNISRLRCFQNQDEYIDSASV